MRLLNKKLLMLVADGVDQQECDQLRQGFIDEGAEVLFTTHMPFISVETVYQNRRGKDIVIDVPFELADSERYAGLIIPDGYLATETLADDHQVISLIQSFHQRELPIFVSGLAVQLLYQSRVLSECILVREGTPITSFIDQAIGILTDLPARAYRYRSSIVV